MAKRVTDVKVRLKTDEGSTVGGTWAEVRLYADDKVIGIRRAVIDVDEMREAVANWDREFAAALERAKAKNSSELIDSVIAEVGAK